MFPLRWNSTELDVSRRSVDGACQTFSRVSKSNVVVWNICYLYGPVAVLIVNEVKRSNGLRVNVGDALPASFSKSCFCMLSY